VYHKVHLLEGPWWVHVVEIDLPRAWQSGIRLRAASARPEQGGVEKTTSLAGEALAAINGDYYISEINRPAGLHVQEGRLLQTPQRRSAFAITREGRPLIAVFQMEMGLITSGGEVLKVEEFNRAPGTGELALYTHRGRDGRDSVRAEVGFQLQSLGKTSILNDTVAVRVLQERHRAWPFLLAPGQWLLAAGAGGDRVSSIAPGDTVQLYCLLRPAHQGLLEAIGGGPRILRDGAISIECEEERLSQRFAQERHPRTAVGYSQDEKTLFLVAVDGRQPGYSVGMSLWELAHFMGRRLADFSAARENAYQALNLDGGGSTTMVVRRQVVNSPSDPTGEEPVANALLVVATQLAGLRSAPSL
jgi:hypothetical protein